ncbi:MAG: hypothetical protein ACJ8GN_26845 [Longimicrobiaceae bacterium]
MSNLTVDENLIHEHEAEPLEGHMVVVLERRGQSGGKFHSVLEPGADPPTRNPIDVLLGRPSPFFGYAVDASKRALTFTEHVEMAERPHAFELQFSMWYRVGDPQALVAARQSDPLGLVRKRIAEVVTREVAELPWSEVWPSFQAAGERVASRAIAELRTFARDFGLAIASLELTGQFPRASAARDELHDTVTHETIEKIGAIIRGTTDMDGLRDVHAGMGGGAVGSAMFETGQQAWQPAIASGNGHAHPALTAGNGGLPGVLSELVSLTYELGPDGPCRRARAALLHLVAAMVADDSLHVTSEQAGFAAKARVEIDKATHLPAGRLEALQNLADPRHLRAWLYP